MYGKIDVLINNVGTNIVKWALQFTEDEWDQVMTINVKTAYLCSMEAGSIMLEQKFGSVLNLSSIYGLGGVPRRLPYATSKSAVESFTRTLACEWAPAGIRVNAIAPGYILTSSMQSAFEQGTLNKDDMVRRTPMGRLGTPEEIADMALYLSSDKASFVTGTVIYVDGGYAAYHGPEANISMP